MNDLAIRLNDLDRLAGLLPDCTTPRAVAEIARAAVEIRPEGETLSVTLAIEIDDSKLGEHLAWLTERAANGPIGKPAMPAENAPSTSAEDAPTDAGAITPPAAKQTTRGVARNLPGGLTEWSDDEKQTLERMWSEGASIPEISAALPGRTARSVGEKRRKMGLPARAAQPGEQGEAAVATVADAPLPSEVGPTESPEQPPEVAPAAPEVAPAAPEAASPKPRALSVLSPALLTAIKGRPVKAPAPETALPSLPAAGLSAGAARILEAMGELDDSFEPDDDKLLVEQRFKGAAMGGIAVELGCDEATVTKRWKQIRACKVDHKGGLMTSRGWADLRAAVAHRAAEQAEA